MQPVASIIEEDELSEVFDVLKYWSFKTGGHLARLGVL
jgi:hypothetical protein